MHIKRFCNYFLLPISIVTINRVAIAVAPENTSTLELAVAETTLPVTAPVGVRPCHNVNNPIIAIATRKINDIE